MKVFKGIAGKWEAIQSLGLLFLERYRTTETDTGSDYLAPGGSNRIYRKVVALTAGPAADSVSSVFDLDSDRTGGTFTLTVDGVTSDPISAVKETVAAVITAELVAMGYTETTDFTMAGVDLENTLTITIVDAGALGRKDIVPSVVDSGTGGSALALTESQAGVAGKSVAHGISDLDDVIRIDGILRSGTTERVINSYDGTLELSCVRVGANLLFYSNTNLAAYTGHAVVEYTKT